MTESRLSLVPVLFAIVALLFTSPFWIMPVLKLLILSLGALVWIMVLVFEGLG